MAKNFQRQCFGFNHLQCGNKAGVIQPLFNIKQVNPIPQSIAAGPGFKQVCRYFTVAEFKQNFIQRPRRGFRYQRQGGFGTALRDKKCQQGKLPGAGIFH